ncbi:MAG: hypothetical protein OXS50_07055, partial [Gammaproteobacteria bacterium]|nr:hypothetical protein [Gammaproteobacteria bacterium]
PRCACSAPPTSTRAPSSPSCWPGDNRLLAKLRSVELQPVASRIRQRLVIVQALAEAATPLSQRQIRDRAATRPATVAEALRALIREGRASGATPA